MPIANPTQYSITQMTQMLGDARNYMPSATIPAAGRGFVAATGPRGGGPIAYEQRDQSTANNVLGIMKADSPLMQQAKTSGLQMANRRGLANSSMAAEASQQAVLAAATPIGSQDAAQNAANNLSDQNYRQNRDITSMGLDSQEGMQAQDINYQKEQRAADRGLQERIATWNIDASDRNYASGQLSTYDQMYSQTLSNINANTNLSAAERSNQIAAARSLRDHQFDLVQQIYTVQLDWGQAA